MIAYLMKLHQLFFKMSMSGSQPVLRREEIHDKKNRVTRRARSRGADLQRLLMRFGPGAHRFVLSQSNTTTFCVS